MSGIGTSLRGIGFLTLVLCASAPPSAAQPATAARSGREVFESTCIACHGPDGKGTVNPALTNILTLPDFSNCNFAVREPDADWLAVAHHGGPARGFSPLMPAWGRMFTADELRRAVEHLRTFCSDRR